MAARLASRHWRRYWTNGERRLFAASEARAVGRGVVSAVTTATGIARGTIGFGLTKLRGGRDALGNRVRRPGGGRKPAVDTQPDLLATLGELVQSASQGDREAALLWLSKRLLSNFSAC